jgi:hypothetical protein
MLRLVYFFLVSYLLLWVSLWAAKEWLVPLDRNQLVRGWRQAALALAHSHPDRLGAGLLGFTLGGVVHTVADVVWSAAKRRRRR